MYFLYDWPTVLDTSSDPSDIHTISILNGHRYFLVIRGEELLFYDQDTFRQRCHLKRPNECIRLHGATVSCCSNLDGTLLALFTTLGYLLLLCLPSVRMNSEYKGILEQAIDDSALDRCVWEEVNRCTVNVGFSVTCSCCYSDLLFVASNTGQLRLIQWKGKSIASFTLGSAPFYQDVEYSRARRISDSSAFCVTMQWAPTLGGVMTILSTGEVALLQPQNSSETHWTLEGILCERIDRPCSLAVNDRFRTVAVGTVNTDVALYRLDETSGVIFVHQYIRISDREYPDAYGLVGPAIHLSWSPDGYCLAIAWKHCGWAICSVFGALLHTSLGERIGLTNRVRLSHLAWSAGSCQLLSFLSFLDPKTESIQVNDTGSTINNIVNKNDSSVLQNRPKSDNPIAHLVVFHFVRSALTTNPTMDNHRHVILHTVDRIIYLSRSRLTLTRNPQTILLPLVYLRQNWPIQYVAINTSGDRIAVAGRRGFAHYHCTMGRWNVFANEVQERSIHVTGGITWWNRFLSCCCLVIEKGTFEFRMYPSERRLDDQFVSAYRFPGQAEPLSLDCLNNLVTVLTSDGRVQILGISATDSDMQKLPLSVVLLQTIDLTNLILFPTCVVRLCLCFVTANLPHCTNASHPQQPKVHNTYPSDIIRLSESTPNSSPTQAESDMLHTNGHLSQPRSLLINYAGHVFILQPSRNPNDSTEEINTTKSRPLILTPFLIATHVELIWTTAPTYGYNVTSQALHPCYTSTPSAPNELLLAPYLNTSLWLYCGSAGLYVWLPLPKLSPSSPSNWNHDIPIHPGTLAPNSTYSPDWQRLRHTHLSPGYVTRRIMLSIELEDHVHPLSILFHQAVLIGIMNDFHKPLKETMRNSAHHLPLLNDFYSILPHGVLLIEIHAFLHRLIQQLLRKNLGAHALHLCSAYQHVPHFRRLLEWLLHEVLESEATSKSPIPDPLLPQVVAFIQEFPHFLETVAQCARKTEVARWPHLFTAVGRRPKDLFELCLDENNLHAAAAYLIMLQSSESTALSQQCTLRLLDVAIDMAEWDLIREIIRFLNAIDPCELKCLSASSPSSGTSILVRSVASDSSSIKHSRLALGTTGGSEKSKPVKASIEIPTASVEVVPTRRPRKSSSRTDSEGDSSTVSSTLSDHIWQLVTRKASQHFAHGRLKEMAELAANFPAVSGAEVTQHSDRLTSWIAQQKPETHLLSNWPESLMRLHQSFAYPLPDTAFVQSAHTSDMKQHLVNVESTVQDARSQPTHHDLTFRQLRYLLSQLLQAESFEWACIVALMVQDHTGLFHSVTLAMSSATKSALSRLKDCHVGTTHTSDDRTSSRLWQRVTTTPSTSISGTNSDRTLSPVFGDPLSRMFAGLRQLNHWAMENCLSYHHFLESLQPELDQVVAQASLFFGRCASGSLTDEPRIPADVVRTGHESVLYEPPNQSEVYTQTIKPSLTSVEDLTSHSEKHIDLTIVSPQFSDADESETVSSETNQCITIQGSHANDANSIDRLFDSFAHTQTINPYNGALDPMLHISLLNTTNPLQIPTVRITTADFDEVDSLNSCDFLIDGTTEIPFSRGHAVASAESAVSCNLL